MSHHPVVVTGRRVRWILAAVVAPFVVATVVGIAALWPAADAVPTLQTMSPGSGIVQATVLEIDRAEISGPQVQARTGDDRVIAVHTPPEYLDELRPGDAIRVMVLPEMLGLEDGAFVFLDFVRGPPLLLLAVVLTVLVVLVARLRGLAALIGLGLSIGGLVWFTLPALLSGRPALPVALVSAAAMMVVLLYLAHGFSARTTTALLGTVAGIGVTAALSWWAVGAAHLTGLSGEDGRDLLAFAPAMQLRGVLLCGFVLAGLGVLNDVTITQASAVWELRALAPMASRREVFARAMRIGRDHIASTVYTVSFAYVGAALPLVLLVAMSDRAFFDVLTAGEIAEEVARTLVGSIGLVLTIPATTAVAAVVAGPGTVVSVPVGVVSEGSPPAGSVGAVSPGEVEETAGTAPGRAGVRG